ncbi:MAG: hypothetical protein AVW05_00860 [Hadesarchaea archaeon DG-33]|nr:MAG: hypothetical protein AVW05_00860 [Hadesarchaea archaeon DG-33]
MNPFGLARWIFDKFWYWMVWSTIFALLMLLLTNVLGNDHVVVTVCSFFIFWGTNFTMDYLKERVFQKVVRR